MFDMKNKLFTFFTLLIIVFTSCQKDETTKNTVQSDFDKEIFNLINDHRASIGLDKLIFSETIWEEAHNHSQNMADETTEFGHDGFSERVDRIIQEIGGNSSAENVAMGYQTANDVVNGWLNSAGHKRNIEGNYTHSAVSAVKNNSGLYYYTQIFINK